MMGFLDELLKKMGKNRAWLGEVSNVDVAILHRINKGKGGKYATLKRIAPFLGLTAAHLAEMFENYRESLPLEKVS